MPRTAEEQLGALLGERDGGQRSRAPRWVGFIVAPDTQYVVQYHLLNTRAERVEATAALELVYADDPMGLEPAGSRSSGRPRSTFRPANNTPSPASVRCSAR